MPVTPEPAALGAPFALAIVGCGPRGLSVLERLLAHRRGGRRLRVLVFEPETPGAGRNWRVDQWPGLLMNTLAEDSSVFPGRDAGLAPSPVPGLDLAEWAAEVAAGRIPAPLEARDQARGVRRGRYAPRALFGAYLDWAYRSLLRAAGPEVEIVHRRLRVERIDHDGRGYLVRGVGGDHERVDGVLLSTGHLSTRPQQDEQELSDAARRAGLRHLPSGELDEPALDRIGAEPVIVRGIGLQFHDLAAYLTIGRSGRFARDDEGALRYLRSGEEPTLFVTSRRGVPAWGRPERRVDWDASRFVEGLAALPDRGPVEFERDVLPLLQDELDAEIRAVPPGADPANPFLGPRDRVDLRIVSDRLPSAPVADHARLEARIVDELRWDVAATRSPETSWTKRVAEVTRTARHWINLHRRERGIADPAALGRYERAAGFIGNGPPVRRIEELHALALAGVVRFLGPADLGAGPSGFVARSRLSPFETNARTLIEAYHHPRDMSRSTEPLIAQLVGSGLARVHLAPGSGAPSGALDVDRELRLIDGAGRPHAAFFALGLPTMGAEFSTAVEIAPGGDAFHGRAPDALARELLALIEGTTTNDRTNDKEDRWISA